MCWNSGLCGVSCSPVVPSSLSAHKYGATCSTSHCLALSPLCPGCPPPPLLLDECFFFNSLVVQLPYSSIFWHFWLFLFLDLLLSLFWLCEEPKCIYLCLHLGRKFIKLTNFIRSCRSRFQAYIFTSSQTEHHWAAGSFLCCRMCGLDLSSPC